MEKTIVFFKRNFNKVKEDLICFYCRRNADNTEFVPLTHFNDLELSKAENVTIYICDDCRSFLSAYDKDSLPQRARFLYLKYCDKYLNFLRFPPWDEEELSEMSVMFQEEIGRDLEIKKFANDLLDNLESILNAFSNLSIPNRPKHEDDHADDYSSPFEWHESPETFSCLDQIDWDNLEPEEAEEEFNQNDDEIEYFSMLPEIEKRISHKHLTISAFVSKYSSQFSISINALRKTLQYLIDNNMIGYNKGFLELPRNQSTPTPNQGNETD